MKAVLTLIVGCLLSLNSFAAESPDSCKAKLAANKGKYVKWSQGQNDNCMKEVNASGATRNMDRLKAECTTLIAVFGDSLRSIRTEKDTICASCSSLSAPLGAACTDEGLAAFIRKVDGL